MLNANRLPLVAGTPFGRSYRPFFLRHLLHAVSYGAPVALLHLLKGP